MSASQRQTGPTASSIAEAAAVREQLQRMLASVHFQHSRRYPSFLRFVVEQALSGRAGQLKERILGIEIFGRAADYDTASDPIVRVTAAEIRKRIALYYEESGRREELRILLPAGSYVPQFRRPGEEAQPQGRRRWRELLIGLLLFAVGVAVGWLLHAR